MALYTMISKNQALNPLKNYKGNDSYARNQMAAFGFGPSVKQTEIYDTLARDSGSSNKNPDSSPNDNFFTKKLKSVENAIGTTFAAAVGGINEGIERQRQDNDAKEYNQKLENILTQAGYNSIDDYYDDKDATEKEIFGKYGLDMDDWQTKRSDAWGASPTAIDQATVDKLDQERQNIKNLMNEEDLAKINRLDDIENARQAENSAYRNKIQQASENYKDYVNNSYIGQKINQDPGKFAGSAMNTLSTATDILLPGAGVVFNAAQGAWEGLADELEENGLQNFDWNRAGQNMLTGAATGGITGILNKGISNKLAQNGGNLFKGGNKLTQAINNAGSNTALGRVGSTLATGAGRGAVSGAVGGATGAGLSAAMNGQDVLESAIQGAQQGFGQGALTGGIMAGANILASKTPGVSVAMQKLNEAGEDWNTRKANGENFGERLTNTWDESTTKALGSKVANSRLGNRIGEDINAIKQGFQDVGQGLNVLANRSGIKDIAQLDVRDLPNILRGNGNEAVLQQLAKNPELRNQLIDDIDNSQVSLNENMADRSQRDFTSGIDKVTRAFDESSNQKVIANRNGLEFSLGDFGNESLSRKASKDNSHGLSEAEIANIIKSSDRQSVAGDSSFRKDNVAWFGDLPDGSRGTVITRKNGLGQEEIINAYRNNPGYEAELVGKFGTPAQSRTGNLGLEDQSIESTIQGRDLSNTSDTSKLHDNPSISQNDQNVNTFPEDIQTMKITDATNTPETEVYRVLTGDDNNRTNGDSLTSSGYKHRQRRNEKLLEQYGTLSRRVTQATQPAKTVGEMADIGFTKPQDVEAAIKYVTGTGGKLNILNQKVVQNASPVSTWDGTEPGQSMSDYIDTQIRLNGLYGTSDGKALTAEINAQLERLPSRRSGSIDFKDAPEDVFSVVQALEKTLCQLRR